LRKINVIEVTHTNAPKVELVKDKLVVQGDYTKHDNTPNDRDISKYLDEVKLFFFFLFLLFV